MCNDHDFSRLLSPPSAEEFKSHVERRLEDVGTNPVHRVESMVASALPAGTCTTFEVVQRWTIPGPTVWAAIVVKCTITLPCGAARDALGLAYSADVDVSRVAAEASARAAAMRCALSYFGPFYTFRDPRADKDAHATRPTVASLSPCTWSLRIHDSTPPMSLRRNFFDNYDTVFSAVASVIFRDGAHGRVVASEVLTCESRLERVEALRAASAGLCAMVAKFALAAEAVVRTCAAQNRRPAAEPDASTTPPPPKRARTLPPPRAVPRDVDPEDGSAQCELDAAIAEMSPEELAHLTRTKSV